MKGIHCPSCGHVRSEIKNTIPVHDAVERYRVCVSCGARFATREVFRERKIRSFRQLLLLIAKLREQGVVTETQDANPD